MRVHNVRRVGPVGAGEEVAPVDPHADQAARRLAEVAVGVRELATRLARAEEVRWRSVAAEAFRAELATVAAGIARAADGVDLAGAALHRHATALERVAPVLTWPGYPW